MNAKRFLTGTQAREEVRRQYERLLEIGYAEAAGFGKRPATGDFGTAIFTLINQELSGIPDDIELDEDAVPVLLVVPERLVPLAQQAAMARLNGRPITLRQGILMELHDAQSDGCRSSDLPYLLYDVRINKGGEIIEFIHPRWDKCYQLDVGGSVLNVVEGLALATHFPERIPATLALPGTHVAATGVAAIGKNVGEEAYRLMSDTCDPMRRTFNGRVAYCKRRLARHVHEIP